ncbi:MAG: hypothetical protein HYZ28_27485 [Myxococcales bacterium]|nr:hypothetical protein [Myxococcales bacterium]
MCREQGRAFGAVALAVTLTAGPGCGRSHLLSEGHYQLALDDSSGSGGVVRDDCGLARHPDVLGGADLDVTGDRVRLDYSLFGITLVGYYLYGDDRFSVDGSAANVSATVSGRECLLDLVTVHLDAKTLDAEHFSGAVAVKLDSRSGPGCACELWMTYTARWTEPSPRP